ncbi:MAG TPA: hypothetical protein VNY29_14765 [Terriglobales bacterium]|nr:hypothetical protein [Terriglobales bacterium]
MSTFIIWYGDWSNRPVPGVLTDFIKNIGGTAYFNINSSYYDCNPGGEKDSVVNRVNYGGSCKDNYSVGTSLTDQNMADIMENAIFTKKCLPHDPQNGIYFVMTSADVIETSGFCSSYCAWHGWDQLLNGEKLANAFIGNSDQCAYNCAWQYQLPTPNNSVAADGMVNMIAHELSETVTDPFVTGWWSDSLGVNIGENGDLCAWTFGKTKFLPNGSYCNVKFGGRPWLIQRIWVNARGGYCALAFDE